MKKILTLFFFFCVTLLLALLVSVQIPSVQLRLKGWIEDRSEGSIHIGKLSGWLPFYVKLEQVSFESDLGALTLNKAEAVISPLSLLTKKLTLLQLNVKGVEVTPHSSSRGSQQGSLLPVEVKHFAIDSLKIGGFEATTLRGNFSLIEEVKLHLQGSYENWQGDFRLVSEPSEKTLALTGRLESPEKKSLPLSLLYSWKTGHVTGTISDFLVSYDSNDNTFTAETDKLKLIGILDFENRAAEGSIELLTPEHFTASSSTYHASLSNGTLLFDLNLRDFQLSDPRYEVFPATHLTVRGAYDDKVLTLHGEVEGLAKTPLTIDATLPLLDSKTPLSIALKGRGAIDPLLAFLENASLIARGEVDLNLTLTGSLEDPKIEGYLIYSEGSIESLTTGALFQQIRMELAGDGPRLVVQSFTAKCPGGGELAGTGAIDWNPEKSFPCRFDIDTHRFTLLAGDPLTASLDAHFILEGNTKQMKISGEATLAEGHLILPRQSPVYIPKVEVTYLSPQIELTTPPTFSLPIEWDVRINIPKNLTIEGRELISEWRGELHIFGLQSDLQYQGRLRLVQGRFNAIGRSFDLTEGRILIEGIKSEQIILNVRGDLELATITASLHIEGPANNPRLNFNSTPPMSTNEILSWILFNQEVSELTPFQAVRLANTVVSLSGNASRPKLWNDIKAGLGIDVFDITGCDFDTGDFTFQVGKYISQGTFVGINKSLSGDYDSIQIQTRLYRDFFLEADYGGSLNGVTPNGGKMIFKWYRTY